MRISKKYELIRLLGKGTFGSVYQGKHVKTGELVAVKLEKNDQSRVLKHETTILNYLYSKSCRNIPPVHMYGIVDVYAYLVMPFYEDTFESFIQSNSVRNTFTAFFSSAIRILGNIHKHGVVHRDIKPDNWMIHGNQLVLIDFGLATFYIDGQGQHHSPSQKTNIIGTPKYVSVHVHEGCEYSRRDDLISLAYIGMYIVFKDEFDWNTPFREMSLDISHESNVHLRQAKQLDSVLRLIPETFVELAKYIESVYSLGFEETPDYDQLANLFLQTQSAENDINDIIGGKV
jgi:serine/threonine protein kinase